MAVMCLMVVLKFQIRDLGSNFFLKESDVGQPRAMVVTPKLAELNRNVKVEV